MFNFSHHTKPLKMDRQLTSQRLLFQLFTPEGFDDYFRVVGNAEAMKWITGKPSTPEEARERFEEILQENAADPRMGYYAVYLKDSGAYIGLGKIVPAGAGQVEIGYALLPDYWRQGFGNEISRRLVEQAATLTGIHRLIAYIAPENQASRRILEKCGFTLERMGDWKGLPAEVYIQDLQKV